MKITLLQTWIRRWKEIPSLLRRHRNLRRFGRHDQRPAYPARPLARTTPEQEGRAARLALIIPYRESQETSSLSQGEGRARQLSQFIEYMEIFLADIDYHIFVIEQSQDNLPFNKGYLMNVGFNLAAPEFDYFAFHDVDQLPTNSLNTYAYSSSPIHLCITTDGHTQSRSMVGGVLLINHDDFVECNGWSNRYLGWGQEDDDMAVRLSNSVGYRRAAKDVGTYRALKHSRVQKLDETYQFYKNRAYLRSCAKAVNFEDGYRDATFDLQSRTKLSAHTTQHVVSIDGPSRRFGYPCYVKTEDVVEGVALFEHATVRSQIVCLRECVIDRSRVCLREGGGEIPEQPIPEELEYAIFQSGALQLRDSETFDPARLGGYQQQLLSSAVPVKDLRSDGEEPLTTFLVERREYVNLYHTLIEIFNTYVSIQLLAGDEPFNLLLLDGHCRGGLDPLWAVILNPTRIYRLHEYPHDATRFKKLIMVPGGYDSPLYNTGRNEPSRYGDFLSDFIGTVLAAYPTSHQPDGGRVLTFVDRRDYQPHPRSDGIACRKVDDLDQTMRTLEQLYPDHRIEVHSFENLPFGEQLRIVRESDVLCGVHGAALVHVLFMRPDSELVEFRPREYRRNDIFENLARLRAVGYRRYFAQTKKTLPCGKLVVQPTPRRC